LNELPGILMLDRHRHLGFGQFIPLKTLKSQPKLNSKMASMRESATPLGPFCVYFYPIFAQFSIFKSVSAILKVIA
jgi:hypothetical protein